MRQFRKVGSIAALLACLPLICPTNTIGAAPPGRATTPATSFRQTSSPIVPSAPPATVIDVVLATNGTLTGQVTSQQNVQLAGMTVGLYSEGHRVATSTADEKGHFQLPVSRGGVYTVQAAGNLQTVRAWTAKAAPPQASTKVILSADPLMRGQPIHPAAAFLGDPWIIALVTTAAIAIPIVLHNNRADRPPSS